MSERSERRASQARDRQGAACIGVWGRSPLEGRHSA